MESPPSGTIPLLLVTEVFPPRLGGSGRWFWELYRRLTRFDVTVVAGPAEHATEFDQASPLRIQRLHGQPPTWGVMNLHSSARLLSSSLTIRRAIVERDPVAVHCGKVLPEGLAALVARLPRSVPIWCFAHGEELTLAQTSRELRVLTRYVLGRAARVVANSRNTRALLLERWHVPEDRIIVLTPGVDTGRFMPAEPDATVRRRLGWDGRRVILTVGALQKRKGQDMLIRALPEIRRRCPDVLYAIAGEGWERAYLEGLAGELSVSGAVRFMGSPAESDLLHHYQQCDLFALPNRQVGWDFEGFGIVLVEAQACARPVVTGTSGGTIETIVPGETGLSVPCETPEALADACIALLDDAPRRAAMGARGRSWVLERFDWAVLAREATAAFLGAPAERQAAGRPVM